MKSLRIRDAKLQVPFNCINHNHFRCRSWTELVKLLNKAQIMKCANRRCVDFKQVCLSCISTVFFVGNFLFQNVFYF
jgi:hypothetical protein